MFEINWKAGLTALAVALTASCGAAAWTIPDGGMLRFQVLREGSPIGTHTLRFAEDADALRVEVVTDVAVDVAFITVYRFAHEGREVWRDGRLVALDSQTDDDGTDHRLTISAEGGKLVVEGDGKRSEAAPGIIPASLWHPELVEQPVLLNTLDGRAMAVDVTLVGTEAVPARGGTVEARHYAIRGDLERDVWYDDAGTLVRVRFTGSDGSDIVYNLL